MYTISIFSEPHLKKLPAYLVKNMALAYLVP